MRGADVALYARVSSEQQAEENTVASQVAAVRDRIAADGYHLPGHLEFIDDGYSGTTLIRPALEQLRDLVAAGSLERLYVLDPDRLARKYAYQVLLVDEFRRAGVEVIFLNHKDTRTAEDELLLQVQGIMAEYERAKILERSRRGKRHAAVSGEINVLSGAPFGYRYVGKHEAGGQARLEILPEQARVVQQIYVWVGTERLSIGEVRRRLDQAGERTRTGKTAWDRSVIWGILKNPAYAGRAAFGKTRTGPLRPRLRAQRNGSLQPRKAYSTYDVPRDEWISIRVPAIVDGELYETVQEQLADNRARAREGKRGVRYLLQGLLVCARCGYAYYGKAISPAKGKYHPRDYAYYRCTGSDAFRFGGQRICQNKQVRTDLLEQAVWAEVRGLLEEPRRLETEYRRRLGPKGKGSGWDTGDALEGQRGKLRQGIARLIDSYAEGLIEKSEFEPRIKRMKERLSRVDEQVKRLADEAELQKDLHLIIGRLEDFTKAVEGGLGATDWMTKREIMRSLIKRVEVDTEHVNVVFRVSPGPFVSSPEKGVLHYCWRRDTPPLRGAFLGWKQFSVIHDPRLEPASEESGQGGTGVDFCEQGFLVDPVEAF